MRVEEARVLTTRARSQTASVRLEQRAQIVHGGSTGQTVPQIARERDLEEHTVGKGGKRCTEQGLAGREDAPRCGAPAR